MSSHNYNLGAEADLKPGANRQIWYYFLVIAVLLMIFIGGLIIMYRFQLLAEKQEKIGQVISVESRDQKALSEALLSGKQGLFPDKRHTSVQDAMAKFLQEVRQ